MLISSPLRNKVQSINLFALESYTTVSNFLPQLAFLFRKMSRISDGKWPDLGHQSIQKQKQVSISTLYMHK